MTNTAAAITLALAATFSAGAANAHGWGGHHHGDRGPVFPIYVQPPRYYAPPPVYYRAPPPLPLVRSCVDMISQDVYGRPFYAGSVYRTYNPNNGMQSERFSNRPCPY